MTAPRILVVDDDEAMRALVAMHLRTAGYSVITAADAVIAGRLVLQDPPDLLIADIEMPYMSGLELAAAMIADSSIPYVPVVLMTAHETYLDRAEALGAGFLVKPFLANRLLAVVGEHLPASAGMKADYPDTRLLTRVSSQSA